MRRVLGGLVVLVAMACPPAALGAETTFNHLPWTQYWTAPPHVNTATFDVYGGEGATSIYFPDSPGGLGGRATATIHVVPGQKYSIYVGDQGRLRDPMLLSSEGGEGSEVGTGSTRLIAAGGGAGGPTGGAGGTPGPFGSPINGGTSGYSEGVGAGGFSWGPPSTKYEVGVRSGEGLVTVSYDPDTFIKSGPRGLINDDTPTFSFATNKGGTSFQCFDEFTFGTCSGPGATHTTEPLADGRHTIAVTSTDAAGNSDPTPATRRFTVDTQAPVVEVTDRPKDTVETDGKQVEVQVRFKSDERRTTFKCRLDEEAYERCDSPYSVKAEAEPGRGTKHRIRVRGTDAAGNAAAPVSFEFRAIRTG